MTRLVARGRRVLRDCAAVVDRRFRRRGVADAGVCRGVRPSRPGDSRPYRPAEPRPGSRAGGSSETGRCPASLARRDRRRPLGSPRQKVSVVKVRPVVVAEAAADPAEQGDRSRHPLRFHRLRAADYIRASVDARVPLTGSAWSTTGTRQQRRGVVPAAPVTVWCLVRWVLGPERSPSAASALEKPGALPFIAANEEYRYVFPRWRQRAPRC